MPASASSNSLPVEKWAKRIAAAWQKQVPSIFETGNLLESAKAELKHGQWAAMIKTELPFGRKTAARLMQISSCDHLRNGAHARHLPATWTVLYELTHLTEQQFERAIKDGAIHPKMQRKEVAALRGEATNEKPRGQKPLGKRGTREVVTHLNSLAWSEANPDSRREFIDAIGVKSLWQAMSNDMRDALLEYASSELDEVA